MADDPSTGPMTLDRLSTLLDCYGAAPERWPADERQSALALLETSAEARALRATAASLDGALSVMQPPPASERAMERVRGMVRPTPRAPESRWGSWIAGLLPSSLPQAAALASVALLAFVLGANLPDMDAATPARPEAAGLDPVAAPADTQSTEDTDTGTIGDLAIVDGVPDLAENGTLELASTDLATTESMDSLTDIPLQ